MRLVPRWPVLGLLSLPAVVLAASSAVPGLEALSVVALIAAVAILAIDVGTSPRPSELALHRSRDALLSIGVPNRVVVTVENQSSQPLRFRVRDEAPDAFRTEPLVLRGAVGPWSSVDISYSVTPFRRGEYRFGRIVLRYRTRLGCFYRQMAADRAERAVVYPDILELRKHTLPARGSDEEIARRLRLHGGTEFERLREYTPDDELRYVDWNATARVHRLIARQYQTERNQNIVLMFDLGRQMTSPHGELLKVDHAINSGVVLGYVATQRGENIGLLTFSDTVRSYLQPRSGAAQFRRILDALYAAQPELLEPDYAGAVAYLSTRNPRRSLIVLFSDLSTADSAEELYRALSALKPKHQPLLVLLTDPALARAAESGTEDEAGLYRKAVAQRLRDERTILIRRLETLGIHTLDVPAERLSVALLDAYLTLKARAAV
ncbi:MAG: DUF58 domain-containing protein [Chloroflexota bacterium]|nr:DUF58 domain-containing protein [Chloroflexota bacterium]